MPPYTPETAIRTPDQRLRVFISSTVKELASERAAARDAITQLRLTPVVFETGARPHPPRELYRAYLSQSDIFIGIYGREYGWVAPGMEISGLEDELLLAAAKPRLIYVRSEAERDPRLEEMLGRIRAEGSVSYHRFSNAEQLRDLIENDLAVFLSERFEVSSSPAYCPRRRAAASGTDGADYRARRRDRVARRPACRTDATADYPYRPGRHRQDAPRPRRR